MMPEGWTKIPLDISLNYRYPRTLFDTQFGGFSDKNESINSNYIKLNNFSWEMKDLIMKIDKLIPFAILVLTLVIAFVA